MVKIIANEIRVGNIIEHKNGLWEVLKIMHTQPGKGGAYIQAEMKEINKNTKLNERFRSSENVEKAIFDEEHYQYSYSDSSSLMLINRETYDQISVEKSLLGDKEVYLQEGMMLTVLSHDDVMIKVKLPKHLTLTVTETEPVVKGQTAAASYKPAILENGIRVMVPPFISTGDKIIVNTDDDSYVERAK